MRKKILFINISTNFGGAEKYLENVIKKISGISQKFEPILLSSRGRLYNNLKDSIASFKSFSRELNLNRNMLGLLLFPFYYFLSFFQIILLLILKKVNIVYANNWGAVIYAYLPSKILRVPLVFHFHGLGASQKKKKIYQKFIAILCKMSDRTIVPGNTTKTELVDWGGDKDRIFVIPNGIDFEEFVLDNDAQKQSRSLIREKFNVKEDEILLLHVGSMVKAKGQWVIIDVLNEIPDVLPKLKVVFVGEGDHLKECKKIAGEKLNTNIFFAGFVKDVRSFLCACDIFVLPSHAETFSISVLEAMIYKKPVIAFDSGGIRDLLSNQEAILVKSNDKKAFSSAIMMLAKNNKLRMSMAQSAHERALHFSFKNTVAGLIDVFESL
jgi:glycosyltransferase involved in cell wall biosynthesis